MVSFLGGALNFNVDDVAPLAAAIDSSNFAQQHLVGLPRFPDRLHHLSHALGLAPAGGLVLEFGVWSGATINLIAKHRREQTVFGFDSFEGLPEAWVRAPAGTFAVETLPVVEPNVELVVGWFDRMLPSFLDSHPGDVSLLHIDCDLYSSTQTILAQLKTRIVPGTIIVFDDYFNYAGWRQHEYLAFKEFVQINKRSFEYVSLVPKFQMVAVRMLK